MKAYLDYLPPTTSAGKTLPGEWRLTITEDDGAPIEQLLAMARRRVSPEPKRWVSR